MRAPEAPAPTCIAHRSGLRHVGVDEARLHLILAAGGADALRQPGAHRLEGSRSRLARLEARLHLVLARRAQNARVELVHRRRWRLLGAGEALLHLVLTRRVDDALLNGVTRDLRRLLREDSLDVVRALAVKDLVGQLASGLHLGTLLDARLHLVLAGGIEDADLEVGQLDSLCSRGKRLELVLHGHALPDLILAGRGDDAGVQVKGGHRHWFVQRRCRGSHHTTLWRHGGNACEEDRKHRRRARR
mmetsp:Transcript_62754/g.172362  ORF Transcript_62754/g.172362 Transcript_62754/m.172362 type:complete len:246 (-) Transcript_62754:25-762(-)